MIGDRLAGRLIPKFERLRLKFGVSEADEDLWRSKKESIQEGQRHLQVMLHTAAAEWTSSGWLDRDRFSLNG